MDCPKCKSEMEQVKYADIEVDRCCNCKGIWFDMLEELHLKKIEGSEVIDSGDSNMGKKFNEINDIKCPKCNADMIKMVDPEQSHIWLESCLICYGVFFDAGEFKDFKEHNIVDKFKSFVASERS